MTSSISQSARGWTRSTRPRGGLVKRETITTGVEVRREGRKLAGRVLEYGDVSPSYRERFEGLDVPGPVTLNLDHDPLQAVAHAPGGGLTLVRDARGLSMLADVPPTPAGVVALHGVTSGRYRGLSVEFVARRERREGGLRVVEQADLYGIGLVSRPAYPASSVEARQTWYGTSIPVNQRVDCRCAGQLGDVVDDVPVREVEFDRDAFDAMLQRVRTGTQDVSAISRGAGDVVADTRTRSLALGRARGGGLDVRVRPLPTDAGRAVEQLVDAGVEVHARPVIDFRSTGTTFTARGGVARVQRADFRYVLVKPTDRAAGLVPLALAGGPDTQTRGVLPWL